jgi:hypothetical protein
MATQRPVNAADLEPRRPASLFHFIPRRSSDRRRPPVIPLSRLRRVRGSSAVGSLSRFVGRTTKAAQRTALLARRGFLNLLSVQKMKAATGDIGHTCRNRRSDTLPP